MYCYHNWDFSLSFASLYLSMWQILGPAGSVYRLPWFHSCSRTSCPFPTYISSVQLLSRVRLFATPWIVARQASLSITNSRSWLRLTSIESVMPSSHLILCRPLLLLPPVPPSIRIFPMSQLFPWVGQSTGVSVLASFLPKKSQILPNENLVHNWI